LVELKTEASLVQTRGMTATARPPLKQSSILRELFELALIIVAVYALVNLVTVRFIVEGPSMESTFHEDDYVIVSRLSYLITEPHHGDVVVFHFPGDLTQDYIKRIIGVPGDTIAILNTQVYVNGDPVDEPYINEPCTHASCQDNTWVLGEDEYFVMGDNRNRSSDSRRFDAPVHREHIIGKVVFRYWPLSKLGLIS
jgi:signal peptidase I